MQSNGQIKIKLYVYMIKEIFISKSLIQKAIKKCISSDAVIVAVPSTDTLKETKDLKIKKLLIEIKFGKLRHLKSSKDLSLRMPFLT